MFTPPSVHAQNRTHPPCVSLVSLSLHTDQIAMCSEMLNVVARQPQGHGLRPTWPSELPFDCYAVRLVPAVLDMIYCMRNMHVLYPGR